jgi:hypothetical protein
MISVTMSMTDEKNFGASLPDPELPEQEDAGALDPWKRGDHSFHAYLVSHDAELIRLKIERTVEDYKARQATDAPQAGALALRRMADQESRVQLPPSNN